MVATKRQDRRARHAALRVTLVLVATVLLATVPSAATRASDPDEWGWAVTRFPGTVGYSIERRDSDSSSRNAVVTSRVTRGTERVSFFWDARFIPQKGNIQVTALTTGAGLCTIERWVPATVTLDVDVRCFGRKGGAKYLPFSVSFLEVNDDSRDIGYVFANSPSNAAYAPVSTYRYNATGATNTIVRRATGRYEVTFPGLPGSGHGQVTAYGVNAVACRVSSIVDTGPDVVLGVICRDRSGAVTDSLFSALYLSEAGPKGSGGKRWAYLYAHRPRRASYTPRSSDRAQRPAGTPRVRRTQRGVYKVRLPNMAKGGAVQVSAAGDSGKQRCHVGAIRKSLPQVVKVRCYTGNGKRSADAPFYLMYSR